MLDDGVLDSINQIAKIEALTRARLTQIMNLLRLPAEMQEFPAGQEFGRLLLMGMSIYWESSKREIVFLLKWIASIIFMQQSVLNATGD